MNIICIMLDSFRQDHVSIYNQNRAVFERVPPCQTPNLDAFAKEAIVFHNAYPEALPTIPVRTQFFTGQCTLPFRPWQPLTREDISIAEILRSMGYITALISDCYHYRAPGMNFHRGFHAYRWIRGQEYDPYTSHPPRRNVADYVNQAYDQTWRERIAQFLANTDDFNQPEDWFAPKVVEECVDWLKKNRSHKNIFLWMDSFDPHEPWDPPAQFDTYTDRAYQGKRLIMPMGGPAEKWASPQEIRFIQGLYAGEAASVDAALGRLFSTLQEEGYYDDSVIVITADHGHPLGDHGKFLKGPDRMYSELLKVPFMIRNPGGKNARHTDALVQFHDLLPTLLDLLGHSSTANAMHGKSFLPVLRGDSDEHRPLIISGFHEGIDRCIRDKTWSYIRRPAGEPDELYNLQEDAKEKVNLIDRFPEEARRLAGSFSAYFSRGAVQVEIKGIQGKYELASGGIH